MIVDRVPASRDHLARALRSAGYVVCQAPGALDALALLHAAGRLPDLLLVAGETADEAASLHAAVKGNPRLSKIAYLAIAAGEHRGETSSFAMHRLIRKIERRLAHRVFPPALDRRFLRA